MDSMKILKNITRIGRVSSVNQSVGSVEVVFPDRDNMVSKPLPVVEFAKIPKVNDQVLCLFLANGIEEGFCLGRYYSKENPPQVGEGS